MGAPRWLVSRIAGLSLGLLFSASKPSSSSASLGGGPDERPEREERVMQGQPIIEIEPMAVRYLVRCSRCGVLAAALTAAEADALRDEHGRLCNV